MMPKKTHGLGRGLDSLFQDMEIEEAGGSGILEIAVGKLDPNPDQPRQTFDDESLAQVVLNEVDLRPAAIIDRFDLRRPIYGPLAAYGHMGREDLGPDGAPWEKVDLAEKLRGMFNI